LLAIEMPKELNARVSAPTPVSQPVEQI